MKFRFILLVLLAAAAASLTSSCTQKTIARDDRCRINVGIVFDIGGKNDRSFNAAAWEGVKRAQQDLPICLYDVEPGNPTSIEPAMRAFAERNFDLVIGVGFAQGPIMQKVAVDYPNIKFAIIDGVIVDKDGNPLPNVADLVFREHEGSYLVGMIAASKSKTGTVGFLGGMDIPLIHAFFCGYKEGFMATNAQGSVFENYTGTTASAWNDPVGAGELAKADFDKGADIVYAAAGASGLGVLQAAKDAGKLSIGVDSNQNYLQPGSVLTSVLKRVDNTVYDAFKNDKDFKGGVVSLGVAEKGVGLAMDDNNKPLITADAQKAVDDATAGIASGTIKVHDYTTDSQCP